MTAIPMKHYKVGGYGLRMTNIIDFVVMVEAHSESEARGKAVNAACKEYKLHPSMVEIETVGVVDSAAKNGDNAG
jgi:hypothetical protein